MKYVPIHIQSGCIEIDNIFFAIQTVQNNSTKERQLRKIL